MSLLLVFKPAARLELERAVAWYEGQKPGLGREFNVEVNLVLEHAQANPGRFRRVRGGARKARLNRFSKYNIYFAVKDDVFMVLTVFHGSRDPAELRRRLE
jgi:toxin ParE1/3/4